MTEQYSTRSRIARALGIALLVGSLATAAVAHGPTEARRGSLDVERVTLIADGTTTGRSVLHRSHRGLRAAVVTSDLERRHAYTVWAVVFNHPEACEGPCDAADLADPAVGGVSTLLTGRIASGRTTMFAGQVPTDVVSDPFGVEVHFVVRTHGRALRGLVREQLTTLNGGCPPNTCANVQMAIHGR